MALPVAQSYSDGTVRNWDDPVVEGQAEPQDPAPSFVTTAAAAGPDGHGSTTAAQTAAVPAASVSTDAPASILTWVALTAGLLGLAAGVAALFRAGRTRKS
ncbi:hypothetical protein Asphe3_40970 (plasmid) [Pseudarthrobacter phenanthrenivorans Sphe3]|uniref:YncI copper-binding domain-containing protein n=1 Tax=Pseudarthrobacter phenanthrenivorans (strain DSM 18606 / JCM 16027 / LMG 23796 / Sphe3) TaxID=930171 RepID=F0MCB2_PSEPM|nr:DUF1775 domain-containing protein [Pseudarthrobacter phenanthrenivorans]ADX75163.1 hypothetical protein Asphe3_40970 [Pseudarthrobacter phenanthrenivorans Sphe3]